MDDLISEFIAETSESLSVLDGELVNLERNPEDTAILGNIFRIMHTIKGTCGFLGLSRLEAIAHASENVLGKIRDKELEASPQVVSLILESLDSIKGLMEFLHQQGQEQPGDDSALIARLNQFAANGSVKSPVAALPVDGNTNVEFPHFRGDDDPEIKAALETMAAPEKPAAIPEPAVEEQEPEAKEIKEAAGPVTAETIRVNLGMLDNLMQMVSELVLTRNQLMQIARTREDNEFLTPLQQLSHITTDLQDGIMKTRMQPIGNAWAKFPRLVRDLSHELGKKIELKMTGAETELDRQMLEIIKDPLTHMVRNSCDHGLETPAERKAAGKPEVGMIALSAYHEGGHIIIEIIDDGRGINIERIKEKALAKGLTTPEALAEMNDKQITQFIFSPGFSTAEKITSISGRGVGMDVVRNNIEKIGGAIDLDSRWGWGSKISVKIPLTLAIVSVLLVETRGQKFAIPQLNVVELVRTSAHEGFALESINDALVMRLRDTLLPIVVLSDVLGFSSEDDLTTREKYIVICKVGNSDFGVLVDRVYDTEEIVVKPVAGILKAITMYAGNTILGDGSVIMILDPNGLARAAGTTEMAKPEPVKKVEVEAQTLERFLLFSIGKGAPKALPLEFVSRIEEMDVKKIECADDYPVVQYRDRLMRLITLEKDFSVPNSGNMEIIVFHCGENPVGLVVKKIIDIVHAHFAITLTSDEAKGHGYLGSMVVEGKATDVVDVNALLAEFTPVAGVV